MIGYAVKYTGKPAMAESRIIDYDGKFITFWYQRHENNKFVEEKIHVLELFSINTIKVFHWIINQREVTTINIMNKYLELKFIII